MWPTWFQFQEGSFDPARALSKPLQGMLEETAYASYYFVLFAFLFSIALMVRRWTSFSTTAQISILVLGSCFFFWLAEHMIIYPDRKYRFPLEPLMIASGSFFIAWVLREFRWRMPRW